MLGQKQGRFLLLQQFRWLQMYVVLLAGIIWTGDVSHTAEFEDHNDGKGSSSYTAPSKGNSEK